MHAAQRKKKKIREKGERKKVCERERERERRPIDAVPTRTAERKRPMSTRAALQWVFCRRASAPGRRV